jgi:hypothetical protein
MFGIHFRFPTQRQRVTPQLQSPGASKKPAGSDPARLSPKKELPPLDPAAVKRIKSRTVILPSQMTERTEVKPVRPPITRAQPDTAPPKDFAPPPAEKKPRTFFGIPIPFLKSGSRKQEEQRIKAGADEKSKTLRMNALNVHDMDHELGRKPEYMEIVRDRHPEYDKYSPTVQAQSQLHLVNHHPEFRAAYAQKRNEKLSVPSGPTATRQMTEDEQIFLTNAFRRLQEDIRNKPFHMHGETAITGNKQGEITQFNHTSALHSHAEPGAGDKFHLHTHPPLMEPLTSSASPQDHIIAANFLKKHDLTGTYVTNGKDVMHIQPHSTELVKLIPDPNAEKKLGTFPVAYQLPDPQRPPYPFANHEAPAGTKPRNPER